jgi:hypothetical protein
VTQPISGGEAFVFRWLRHYAISIPGTRLDFVRRGADLAVYGYGPWEGACAGELYALHCPRPGGMVVQHKAVAVRKTSHRALVLVSVCLSMSALGGEAAATPLTSISWTVTGGSLFTSGVMGTTAPITGGSVVWTPSSVISTPTIMPLQTPHPGSLRITLQSAGTSVALTFLSLIGTITPLYAVLGGPFPVPANDAFASVNYFAAYQVAYVFFLNSISTHDSHIAVLGQEVRAVVPEPSTGSLLALGLIVLTWTAGAGTRRRGGRARS